MNVNWSETIYEQLIPTLKNRTIKQKVAKNLVQQRKSKFIQEQYDIVAKMLTGEYKFDLMENSDKLTAQKLSNLKITASA